MLSIVFLGVENIEESFDLHQAADKPHCTIVTNTRFSSHIVMCKKAGGKAICRVIFDFLLDSGFMS